VPNAADAIAFDFHGVENISRAFADELCALQDASTKPIRFVCTAFPVAAMLLSVRDSRDHHRHASNPAAERADIINARTTDDLTAYFKTF